jgi:hypothetical protein
VILRTCAGETLRVPDLPIIAGDTNEAIPVGIGCAYTGVAGSVEDLSVTTCGDLGTGSLEHDETRGTSTGI